MFTRHVTLLLCYILYENIKIHGKTEFTMVKIVDHVFTIVDIKHLFTL